MIESIFKGFQAHDGTKELNILTLEDEYIHLIRTDSNNENGYIYFNGKKYGNGVPNSVVYTTYSELKSLRDSDGLSVGTWYCITDYDTTVYNNENARAAGHPFDILVLATDVNQLSEDAKAVHSERDKDGYFAHANLSAWKLKYSLDNDTTKFAWAGEGKGVVWEMEDEFNNLCSYDFKNIQFKRSLITSTLENASEEKCVFYGKYVGQVSKGLPSLPQGYVIDPNDSKYLYTFSVIADDGGVQDNSMPVDLTSTGMGIIHFCGLNRIRENANMTSFAFGLNNNVFVATCNSDDELMNRIVVGNTFGGDSIDNTFVNATIANSFENFCYNNSFGKNCYGNTFEDNFQNNTCGNDFKNNTHGNNFKNNTLGNYLQNNTFGNDFQNNKCGNDFKNNKLGNAFKNNTLGSYFQNNTFGNAFQNNKCGNDFKNNILGNNFQNNTFGNYCKWNSFGNSCQYIEVLNNVQYITVFEGVMYVSIGNTNGTIVQYAQVLNGTKGPSASNKLKIDFVGGTNYTQIAGQNSAGELKIWVPADMVATT